MGNPYLHVYLGKAKRPWEERCKRLGQRPGIALKKLVEKHLRAALGEVQFTTQTESLERGPKVRLALRLTETERARILESAQREGCSPQTWVVNVVRATLTRQPQLGMRELEALGESNYQLLAIGRNLNQIAKRLNEGEPEHLTLEEIRELRRQIDAHTQTASTAIRASIERWAIR
jgi:hypothetical protein